MITPIKNLNVMDLIKRKNDLLVSVSDIKAIAKNERDEIIACLPRCSISDDVCNLSKDDCFECMYQALDRIEEKLNIRGAEQ